MIIWTFLIVMSGLLFARRITRAGEKAQREPAALKNKFVHSMFCRMLDRKFAEDFALYIIWSRPRQGGMRTLAAWDVVQKDCPADEIAFQHRARVLMS